MSKATGRSAGLGTAGAGRQGRATRTVNALFPDVMCTTSGRVVTRQRPPSRAGPRKPTAGLEPATPSLRACAGPETWEPSRAWTYIKYLLTAQLCSCGAQRAPRPFPTRSARCTRLVLRGRRQRGSRSTQVLANSGPRRHGSLSSGAGGGHARIHAQATAGPRAAGELVGAARLSVLCRDASLVPTHAVQGCRRDGSPRRPRLRGVSRHEPPLLAFGRLGLDGTLIDLRA